MSGASIASDPTLFQVRAVNGRNRESPGSGGGHGMSLDGRRSAPAPYREEPPALTGCSLENVERVGLLFARIGQRRSQVA